MMLSSWNKQPKKWGVGLFRPELHPPLMPLHQSHDSLSINVFNLKAGRDYGLLVLQRLVSFETDDHSQAVFSNGTFTLTHVSTNVSDSIISSQQVRVTQSGHNLLHLRTASRACREIINGFPWLFIPPPVPFRLRGFSGWKTNELVLINAEFRTTNGFI